jgi:hypothetical protein
MCIVENSEEPSLNLNPKRTFSPLIRISLFELLDLK